MIRISILANLIFILTSASAFAGGFNFECSTGDGSVQILDRGFRAKIYDKEYVSLVKLPGIDLWDQPFDEDLHVDVVQGGRRTELYRHFDNSCREILELKFVQKLKIVDRKTKQVLFSDFMICDHGYATTTGGRDCSKP